MTIEQVKENKERLQSVIRQAVLEFIQTNPGCLPAISVDILTEKTIYNKRRIFSVDVELAVTIL